MDQVDSHGICADKKQSRVILDHLFHDDAQCNQGKASGEGIDEAESQRSVFCIAHTHCVVDARCQQWSFCHEAHEEDRGGDDAKSDGISHMCSCDSVEEWSKQCARHDETCGNKGYIVSPEITDVCSIQAVVMWECETDNEKDRQGDGSDYGGIELSFMAENEDGVAEGFPQEKYG